MPKTRLAMEPSAVEFEYRLLPRWWHALLVAAVMIGLFYLARSTDDLVLAICAWFFVLGGVLYGGAYLARLLLDHRVRVTKDHLILPRRLWSRDEVAIAFRQLHVGKFDKDRYIEVKEGYFGELYTIWSNFLSSRAAWERLYNAIHEHIAAAQPPEEK